MRHKIRSGLCLFNHRGRFPTCENGRGLACVQLRCPSSAFAQFRRLELVWVLGSRHPDSDRTSRIVGGVTSFALKMHARALTIIETSGVTISTFSTISKETKQCRSRGEVRLPAARGKQSSWLNRAGCPLRPSGDGSRHPISWYRVGRNHRGHRSRSHPVRLPVPRGRSPRRFRLRYGETACFRPLGHTSA